MARVFIYVVDRDFGFAPNPFHGICTLATCKPRLRSSAQPGDWVIGVGGARLQATGRCIFAMHVSEKLTFNAYWDDPRFLDKRPVREGSMIMLVGDNIYRQNEDDQWVQADSHHSNADGTPNPLNVANDTSTDAVLIAKDFYYFGAAAPEIPPHILADIGYMNGRNHRVFEAVDCDQLLEWLQRHRPNFLHADPNDFVLAAMRYSGAGSKLA